jgi:hypothetical protein
VVDDYRKLHESQEKEKLSQNNSAIDEEYTDSDEDEDEGDGELADNIEL